MHHQVLLLVQMSLNRLLFVLWCITKVHCKDIIGSRSGGSRLHGFCDGSFFAFPLSGTEAIHWWRRSGDELKQFVVVLGGALLFNGAVVGLGIALGLSAGIH